MNRPNAVLSAVGRPTWRAALWSLALCFLTVPAQAEPPMWLIEDEDSTIYLFGTVHLLDPEIAWLSPRVEQALDEASAVWFETPMPPTLEEMQAQQGPLLMQRALSPGRPLSSLLSEEENVQLERALARTPMPEQLALALENMKPWLATLTLGVAPLLAAGYDANAGADVVLARLAHEQGDDVLGFETSEHQLDLFARGSEEEQLRALRAFLAVPDEKFDAELARGDAAFRAWMAGETAPLEGVMESWRRAESPTAVAMPYDIMVANRNEDWAGQIEELLAAEGVAFIAVGAGHLVGPDNVQTRLAERGIAAERR